MPASRRLARGHLALGASAIPDWAKPRGTLREHKI